MTGLDVITDALIDLGVQQAGEPVSAEDADLGLRRLNALASALNLEAPFWQLPVFDLSSTELSVGEGVEQALVSRLAVELAPAFERRELVAELRYRARKAEATLRRRSDQPSDMTMPGPFTSSTDGAWWRS